MAALEEGSSGPRGPEVICHETWGDGGGQIVNILMNDQIRDKREYRLGYRNKNSSWAI